MIVIRHTYPDWENIKPIKITLKNGAFAYMGKTNDPLADLEFTSMVEYYEWCVANVNDYGIAVTHTDNKAIVEDLILAAIDFGLGDFVKRFFFDHRDVIFEYETNGGTGLYELFETATDSELDETNADGQSPRVYALEILG